MITDIVPAAFMVAIGLSVTLWALSLPHTRQPRRSLTDLLKGGDE